MNNQMDLLTIANFVFSGVTTTCALYLSYVALQHSAKPNIKLRLLSPRTLECNETNMFIFEFTNIGHWYAKPTAIDMVVFCNFDSQFKLIELRYGSTQSYSNTEVRTGVGKMIYLKAKGIKLTHGEEGEEVHVKAVTPKNEGKYKIRISAYSENGVSIRKEFVIKCKRTQYSNSKEKASSGTVSAIIAKAQPEQSQHSAENAKVTESEKGNPAA